MFVRVKTRSNGKRSIQIVESYRRGDKVHQKIIRHVGQAMSDKEEATLKQLAHSIIVEMKNNRQPVLPIFSPEDIYNPERRKKKSTEDKVFISKLREDQRLIVGLGEVFGKLYSDLGFDSIIKKTRKDKQWNSILKTCVISRLANPSSKRETASFLEQDYGIKVPLEKIYRMMDHLDGFEDEIKHKVSSSSIDLLGQHVNIVFFDVTTLYFESIKSDDLREFGFSKDCKFKEVQVVLALITTEHGLPIGYELFPGNTFEGHTLIETVSKVRSKFNALDITLVADRGLLSEQNLSALEKQGIQYIIGAKLRKMDKKTQESILEAHAYKASCVANELHWLKEVDHKGRRLVVSYSKKRAAKDAKDRQRFIDRLMKRAKDGKIKIKDLIPNYGTKKYLQVDGGKATINEQKMVKDALWDGIHGIISNVKNKPHCELVEKYRGLWQVEEAFRVNKHDLKMRPIFHWKPQRIKAHIAICFLAYTLAKQAVYRVNQQAPLGENRLSFKQLRNELLHAQSSLLRDIESKKKYLLPSNVTGNQKKIYKVFGLKRSEVSQEVGSLGS